MIGQKWLLQQEAADFLGVSAATVQLWRKKGMIKSYDRPGKRFQYYNSCELRKLDLKKVHGAFKRPPKGKKERLETKKNKNIYSNLDNCINKFNELNKALKEAIDNHIQSVHALNNTTDITIDLVEAINKYMEGKHERTDTPDNG